MGNGFRSCTHISSNEYEIHLTDDTLKSEKTAEKNSKVNALYTHTHRIGMWEKHAEQSSY